MSQIPDSISNLQSINEIFSSSQVKKGPCLDVWRRRKRDGHDVETVANAANAANAANVVNVVNVVNAANVVTEVTEVIAIEQTAVTEAEIEDNSKTQKSTETKN